MSSKSFIEKSKINWIPANDEQPSTEQLTLGCLQRIALSSETMAKNNADLEADRDWYKKRYSKLQEENASLKNTIKSLRSWVTRWKNKAVRP